MNLTDIAFERIERNCGFKKGELFNVWPATNTLDLLPFCSKKHRVIYTPILCGSLLNLKNASDEPVDDVFHFMLAHRLAQYGCYNDAFDVLNMLSVRLCQQDFSEFDNSMSIMQMEFLLLHEMAHIFYYNAPPFMSSYFEGIEPLLEKVVNQAVNFQSTFRKANIANQDLIEILGSEETKNNTNTVLEYLAEIGRRNKEEFVCDLFAFWQMKHIYRELTELEDVKRFFIAIYVLLDTFDIGFNVNFSCNSEEDADPVLYSHESTYRAVRRSFMMSVFDMHYPGFMDYFANDVGLENILSYMSYFNVYNLELADKLKDNLKHVRESTFNIESDKEFGDTFFFKVVQILYNNNVLDGSFDFETNEVGYHFEGVTT